jgi:hypothetical protein
MKMKKRQRLNSVFKLIAPSVIGLVVEGLAIFVGHYTHNKFYAGDGNSCAEPPIPPTLTIAVIGVVIALFGIVRVFKQKHYYIGALTILLGLVCVALGLLALFILAFEICF